MSAEVRALADRVNQAQKSVDAATAALMHSAWEYGQAECDAHRLVLEGAARHYAQSLHSLQRASDDLRGRVKAEGISLTRPKVRR